MNLRRGLLRLWIVGTALFVLAVAFVSYSEIKQQFDTVALQRWADANSAVLVPTLCGQARGDVGVDYSTSEAEKSPNPYAKYKKPNPYETCWYDISKFRPLYPEYNDLSDKELTQKLYAAHGMPIREPPNPWVTLGVWASIALGIPLAVLALGSSLVWAFSGFAAKPS
jgi:hypothetical protein